MDDDLSSLLECYHQSARRFAGADPAGVKDIYSRAHDVVLANPFGPAVVGWEEVGPGLEFASSRLLDGDVPGFEVLAQYDSGDLVVLHTLEHWAARIAGRQDVEPFDLRATSVLRREDGQWGSCFGMPIPSPPRTPRAPCEEGDAATGGRSARAGPRGTRKCRWSPVR